MAYIRSDISIEVSLPEAFCILAALAEYAASGDGGEMPAEILADLGTQLGVFEDEEE